MLIAYIEQSAYLCTISTGVKIVKKKIAILLMFVFSFLSVLTGCNLFDTDNYAALSSIVATSGDIQITREEMLNAYYNGNGYYYYAAYGYSQEDSFKMTINDLIDNEYLLKHIDSLGTEYQLTSDELCKVVQDTWEYVDDSYKTYIEKVRDDFDITTKEVATKEEEKPEFDPQKVYEPKFELQDGQIVYVYEEDEEDLGLYIHETLASEEDAYGYAKANYSVANKDYRRHISGNDNYYKDMVWSRYMTALKLAQKNYGYDDMSDKAVFERQLKKIFDANLNNAKLTKFEKIETKSKLIGVENVGGKYVITDDMLEKMVAYYKDLYLGNQVSYVTLRGTDEYAKAVATSSATGNYVYFGDDQDYITCLHILVKFSDEQKNEVSKYENDDRWQGEQLANKLADIKSASNTKSTRRDLETGLEIEGEEKSVQEMYDELTSTYFKNLSLGNKTQYFNNLMYAYNMDPGIINAEFDYVVGTKYSGMVQSFTDAVRDLYNNGEVGDIKLVKEENDQYSGYHIIMYTGKLESAFTSAQDMNNRLNKDTIYNILSNQYTSLAHGETMFDYIYSKALKSTAYNTHRAQVIAVEKNGVKPNYITQNFSDLY